MGRATASYLVRQGDTIVKTPRHRTGQRIGGGAVMSKLKKFDAAEYLDTPERQAAYIAAAFETGDAAFARDALGIVARAHGMNKIATVAGLNRESLYKALGVAGNPEFGTVMGIMRAIGLTMSVRPAVKQSSKKHRVSAKTVRRVSAKAARASAQVDA